LRIDTAAASRQLVQNAHQSSSRRQRFLMVSKYSLGRRPRENRAAFCVAAQRTQSPAEARRSLANVFVSAAATQTPQCTESGS
jgi:hypothetical protein